MHFFIISYTLIFSRLPLILIHMLKNKALVLYKNQIALVEETGEKYKIIFAGGTQKVREKDVVLLHEGPAGSIQSVSGTADVLFAEPEKLELKKTAVAEAWELLDGQEATLGELAELIFGSYTPEHAWAAYRLLCETPWFELSDSHSGGCSFRPRKREEAEASAAKAEEKGREQELRAAFLSRLKKKQLDFPGDTKFMQDVEALALGKTDKSKTLREAGLKETPEAAHKLLLATSCWNIYRNPHPSRWGLSAQSAAETLSRPPEEQRLDLTGKPEYTAFAIDNEWSSDPDDAVCFDGEYLWIHVADPASTVFPGSKIDTAARSRGATLYLPEGAARMLAEESLEDYALGLTPVSRALSFRIRLDESGAVTDSAVFKTLVAVKRLPYGEADAQKNSQHLDPLFADAQKDTERRKHARAVNNHLPEIHISAEKKDGTADITIEEVARTESADMVREMMLLAGEAAARFAFKNAIPFPYISQDAPDLPRELPDGLAGQYRLRRSMKSRRVGVTPSAHAGLGLGMYSQVTSPLRRYSDLVAHQQLRAFIDGRKPLDRDTVLERISAGDAAASAAVQAERKSRLHWILAWLTAHPEWNADAVVVEQRAGKTVLFIPSLAQETQLVLSGDRPLNSVVRVRAGNISIPDLTVTFAEV